MKAAKLKFILALALIVALLVLIYQNNIYNQNSTTNKKLSNNNTRYLYYSKREVENYNHKKIETPLVNQHDQTNNQNEKKLVVSLTSLAKDNENTFLKVNANKEQFMISGLELENYESVLKSREFADIRSDVLEKFPIAEENEIDNFAGTYQGNVVFLDQRQHHWAIKLVINDTKQRTYDAKSKTNVDTIYDISMYENGRQFFKASLVDNKHGDFVSSSYTDEMVLRVMMGEGYLQLIKYSNSSIIFNYYETDGEGGFTKMGWGILNKNGEIAQK